MYIYIYIYIYITTSITTTLFLLLAKVTRKLEHARRWPPLVLRCPSPMHRQTPGGWKTAIACLLPHAQRSHKGGKHLMSRRSCIYIYIYIYILQHRLLLPSSFYLQRSRGSWSMPGGGSRSATSSATTVSPEELAMVSSGEGAKALKVAVAAAATSSYRHAGGGFAGGIGP